MYWRWFSQKPRADSDSLRQNTYYFHGTLGRNKLVRNFLDSAKDSTSSLPYSQSCPVMAVLPGDYHGGASRYSTG